VDRPVSSSAKSRNECAVRRAAALVVACAALAACAPKAPVVLAPLRELETRTPVVLLPGTTGTRLADAETGRLVWGNGRSVFFPRDGGRSMALPIGLDPAAADDVVAAGPVTEIRVGFFKFEFYRKLIRLMEANGYRYGDLERPTPEDSFFIFGYDWRYGNASAARDLAARLQELRRVRGEDVLEVDLICQSNAGRVARYMIKYGGATLEEAEAGRGRPPERIRVDKLILVGTDNGGALGILEELDRGRSYFPILGLGRKIRPEVVFTFRSLYEGFPPAGRRMFVDEDGEILDVDLYDPESWETYGWSIFSAKAEKRLAGKPDAGLFGDEPARRAFLARHLDRGRRMHRLLAADVPELGASRYYMVQNAYRPTDTRAVLVRRKGRWRTLFLRDKPVRKDDYLMTLVAEPGDGHATVESQMSLSPQERQALVHPPVLVDALHRLVVLREATHRYILKYLAEE
jgi:hypothetical protein